MYMLIQIFECYNNRSLYFTEEVQEIISWYEASDLKIINDLEQVVLDLLEPSQKELSMGDIVVAIEGYFEGKENTDNIHDGSQRIG